MLSCAGKTILLGRSLPTVVWSPLADQNRTRVCVRSKCRELCHQQPVSCSRQVSRPCKHLSTAVLECKSRSRSWLTACLLSGWIALSPAAAWANSSDSIQAQNYVLDTAKVIPDDEQNKLEQKLKDLEQQSGWRIRVLTRFGPNAGPTGREVKEAWALDDKTTIVIVDPSSPNILAFNTGEGVERLLSRSFFIELQSRYGNKFFVRDEATISQVKLHFPTNALRLSIMQLLCRQVFPLGEDAAVQGTVGALSDCLQRPGGCAVVPGLPSDQYTLTLISSCVGGFVFGYSLRLPPSGPVQRKFIWSILFFPLWGSLFINFGIGPIVSRTSDKLPLAGNVSGFLAAAAVLQLSPLFSKSAVEGPLWKKDD